MKVQFFPNQLTYNSIGYNMTISKIEKMNVLGMIKRGETIPFNEHYNFILFDLLEDDMIVMNSDASSINLTYFGFKELEDWDPFLKVSINNQLLLKPYGEA